MAYGIALLWCLTGPSNSSHLKLSSSYSFCTWLLFQCPLSQWKTLHLPPWDQASTRGIIFNEESKWGPPPQAIANGPLPPLRSPGPQTRQSLFKWLKNRSWTPSLTRPIWLLPSLNEQLERGCNGLFQVQKLFLVVESEKVEIPSFT